MKEACIMELESHMQASFFVKNIHDNLCIAGVGINILIEFTEDFCLRHIRFYLAKFEYFLP